MQTGNAGKLTGAEVVNDDSKVATVKVTGKANGKPFVVERSVKRSFPTNSLRALPNPRSTRTDLLLAH